MEYVLFYASPLLMAAITISIILLLEKSFPTTIKKSSKGRLGDSYSVSVCTFAGKGSSSYIEHVFTKRNSGRYRLRFGLFEIIIAAVCIVPIAALCIWLTGQLLDMTAGYTMGTISYIIVITLDLLLLAVLLCNSIIRAVWFFKRFESKKQ